MLRNGYTRLPHILFASLMLYFSKVFGIVQIIVAMVTIENM